MFQKKFFTMILVSCMITIKVSGCAEKHSQQDYSDLLVAPVVTPSAMKKGISAKRSGMADSNIYWNY